jgi:restriction system protein
VHQQGIIITTSDFSKSAREEASAANKTRIGLINGKELIDLLIKHQVGVVKRTLEVTALDEEYWSELVGEAGIGATAEAKTPVESERAPAKTPKQETEKKKPQGFTLLGQPYAAGSWRGVLLGVCEALAMRHGAAFGPAAMAVKGRTRQYVADSPEGMIAPAQIPGTELWVEANQSAKSVQRLVAKLLSAVGHAPEEFAVSLA